MDRIEIAILREKIRCNIENEIKDHTIDDTGEQKIIDAMLYFTQTSGKYLRGILVIETAKSFNITENDIMPVAIAIEFVHAYSLIHDDLPALDNSDMRRGQMSLHKQFDEATAILVGNTFLTIAFQILSKKISVFNPEAILKLITSLCHYVGIYGIIGGQMLDIRSSNITSHDEFIHMDRKKTGSLFAFCTSAGAILSQSDNKTIKVMQEYGYNIGLIYQILDDIIDINDDGANIVKILGGVESAKEYIKMLCEQEKSKIAHHFHDHKHLKKIISLIDLVSTIPQKFHSI